MSEFVLTSAERALFEALDLLGVRYLLVGMGAALIEGAHGTTQGLDIWFGHIDAEKVAQAARRAGGFYRRGSACIHLASVARASTAWTWS